MEKLSLGGMLTIRQVAGFMNVSISTVRRWSDKGMLNCYHVGSRGDRRYRRRDILHFLEKSTRHLCVDTVQGKDQRRCRHKGAFYLN